MASGGAEPPYGLARCVAHGRVAACHAAALGVAAAEQIATAAPHAAAVASATNRLVAQPSRPGIAAGGGGDEDGGNQDGSQGWEESGGCYQRQRRHKGRRRQRTIASVEDAQPAEEGGSAWGGAPARWQHVGAACAARWRAARVGRRRDAQHVA